MFASNLFCLFRQNFFFNIFHTLPPAPPPLPLQKSNGPSLSLRLISTLLAGEISQYVLEIIFYRPILHKNKIKMSLMWLNSNSFSSSLFCSTTGEGGLPVTLGFLESSPQNTVQLKVISRLWKGGMLRLCCP